MSPYAVCVCFILRETADGRTEVLLGRKKDGLGSGNIVGPGGKIEPGESEVQAIVREISEEVGLDVDPDALRRVGRVEYEFPTHRSWSQNSTIFLLPDWSGAEPIESDELAPAWYDVDALPLDDMWDDARLWLPGALAGETVAGRFRFGADRATVEEFELGADALG
jgi:8-oxo-dGTP diphosphatase